MNTARAVNTIGPIHAATGSPPRNCMNKVLACVIISPAIAHFTAVKDTWAGTVRLSRIAAAIISKPAPLIFIKVGLCPSISPNQAYALLVPKSAPKPIKPVQPAIASPITHVTIVMIPSSFIKHRIS